LEYFASKDIRVSPERDGVRVSLGMFNNESDIDRLLTAIKERGVKTSQSTKAA
jgi:cysteine desulfurase/selenocysteine lyase